MKYFKYGKKETKYLKQQDPILGKAIDEIGMVYREINSNIFEALVSSIISQQISTKAAITVKARLVKLLGQISPEKINSVSIDDIQKCGMSMRKADYIKGIADAALSGTIDFDSLHKLSDIDVTKKLTSLRGVGQWTAEMLLIHSLERPDIVSYKDLGIRRGIMKLYELEELPKKQFQVYKKRYSPYGTVASIYLWEISGRKD
ncbi:MAG TPA: DNA-3-methyladenine glycosylase, partial [Tissierellaceae bacterium]|nr:DNA-3-methyladenine glycosylase [Tissierellaceae bacterium]